ncbi:murein DD-endopeptidase MepM [Andreesenia angusta]|uniref:Murein DD-endopeptidase MepM n=1 Tax=Andreesenia angusta TaxID=39480 RepID=A0A1S1V4Q4_9FIRM|nr:peptidoglycan DD-metalloendopeptidase family protein [Andreesenia angusta]OHW61636.1 murein DD-endopeptidase MepM [Andreesenia angusta]
MKRIKSFLKDKRNTVGIGMATAVLLSSTIGFAVYQESGKAYEVKVDKEVVGVVSKKSSIDRVLESIEDEKSTEYKKEVVLDEAIEVEAVKAEKAEMIEPEELKSKLEEKVVALVDAVDIVIEGEAVVSVDSQEDAAKIVESLKSRNMEKYGTEHTVEAKIVQSVEPKASKVDANQVKSIEEAVEIIETGGVEVVEHEMKPGENFWTISKDYNTTSEAIEAANPDKDPTKVRDGEIVKINSPKPYITVELVEELEVEEETAFETTYETSEEMYNDTEAVKTEGVNGKSKKKIKKTSVNGNEVKSEVLSEEILLEPVSKVIVKGTKERPSGVGTGNFQTPANGYISSRFGPRWGTIHRGLDIAAPTGTTIVASDSGKVTYAGYNNGGYGYMVKISHGNGFETLYAHSSQLYVSVGDVVNAGDVIAAIGSTGNSTGPHLHFEVIKNGEKVNPENYI